LANLFFLIHCVLLLLPHAFQIEFPRELSLLLEAAIQFVLGEKARGFARRACRVDSFVGQHPSYCESDPEPGGEECAYQRLVRVEVDVYGPCGGDRKCKGMTALLAEVRPCPTEIRP